MRTVHLGTLAAAGALLLATVPAIGVSGGDSGGGEGSGAEWTSPHGAADERTGAARCQCGHIRPQG